MKTQEIFYDETGAMLAPVGSMADGPVPSEQITLDVGFWHRHKLPEHSDVKVVEKSLQRFMAIGRRTPGFRVVDAKEYRVRIGGYHRVGLELLYVVEAPVKKRSTPQEIEIALMFAR